MLGFDENRLQFRWLVLGSVDPHGPAMLSGRACDRNPFAARKGACLSVLPFASPMGSPCTLALRRAPGEGGA